MADDTSNPVAVAHAYFDRFGEGADFDRWIFPSDVNVALMRRALDRGSPVTRADLERVSLLLYEEPLGDPPPPGAVT